MNLPPNQQLVAAGKWPLVGQREPLADARPWTVSVTGAVERPRTWSLAELQALPQTTALIDIHCVTRWSKLGATFTGIPLAALLAEVGATADARYVSFVARSAGAHHTSLPLDDALRLGTLIALAAEGVPLETAHGGPVRTVVAGRYFYKSLKWLERIELLESDRLGTWESGSGYHNTADPWQEQRYMAPGLTKAQAAAILASRNIAGLELRSIDARGHDLAGLQGSGALLRDADFRGCNLQSAVFERANLSNARLTGANLRGASFVDADVEGASFEGADLAGANFRGASVTGASFCDPRSDGVVANAARIDGETSFALVVLENLTPLQQECLRQAGWS